MLFAFGKLCSFLHLSQINICIWEITFCHELRDAFIDLCEIMWKCPSAIQNGPI